MKRKVISVILSALLSLLPVLNAGAAYRPGPTTFSLTSESITQSDGATVSSDGSVSVKESGKVVYDLFLSLMQKR